MEVLRDYQYVDSRGMGIRTKVIPIMREFNGTEPEFEASDDFLKTTLFNNGPKNDPNEPKKVQNETINETIKYHDEPKNEPKDDIERIVVGLLIANPKSSYTDMISATGKSRITVRRLLDSLKEKGIIERVGPKNGGKRIVKR